MKSLDFKILATNSFLKSLWANLTMFADGIQSLPWGIERWKDTVYRSQWAHWSFVNFTSKVESTEDCRWATSL